MNGPQRAVITGRGVLSPLACDWPAFAAAVRARTVAPAGPFPGSLPDDPPLCHLVSDPEALTPLPSGGEVEPLSALATAAAREALQEAGVPLDAAPLDDVGLVMNTVFGPSTAVQAYLGRLWEGGPMAARPALFIDTLLSMPAGRAGIALRLRGSTAVLGGSSPFELALEWVRGGREHTVVAGGGECHAAKCLRFQRALAGRSGAERPLPAEGVAFVVLEAADHARARGARPLAELSGAGAASEPQESTLPWSADPEGRAFACAMRAALADAAVEPEAVQLVTLAAGDDAAEAGELAALRGVFGPRPQSLALLRPKRLLGEALGGSAALALLATLADLEGSAVTEPALAVVNSFEMGGAVTSLVLRVAPS